MWYTSVWDPTLIIYQIIVVQSIYYVQLGVFLFIFNQMVGHMFSVEQIFNYRLTNTDSMYGWMVIIANFFNAICGALSLLIFVERSKKCLDHAATVTILHLIACSIYGGFPASWSWWLVNVLCCIVMALFGEYLCMRRELREIPIVTKGFGTTPYSPIPTPLTYTPSSPSFSNDFGGGPSRSEFGLDLDQTSLGSASGEFSNKNNSLEISVQGSDDYNFANGGGARYGSAFGGVVGVGGSFGNDDSGILMRSSSSDSGDGGRQ